MHRRPPDRVAVEPAQPRAASPGEAAQMARTLSPAPSGQVPKRQVSRAAGPYEPGPAAGSAGTEGHGPASQGLSRGRVEPFADRAEAGRLLAVAARHLAPEHPVVVALPRGGVPVAAQLARELRAPLELVLVRKIGAPQQPELAVAAVAALPAADGGLGPVALVVDEAILRAVGAGRDHVDRAVPEAQTELQRRRLRYLGARPPVDLAGRCVIVVDDGVATGTTLRAALAALRRVHPARVVLAVPVAPPQALAALGSGVDEVLCLRQPAVFHAVGAHYLRFEQVSDSAVLSALEAATTRPRVSEGAAQGAEDAVEGASGGRRVGVPTGATAPAATATLAAGSQQAAGAAGSRSG